MPLSPSAARTCLPSFIGIGAPKAATTWITNTLASHPRLYVPPIKETHFFDYPYTQYPFEKYSQFFVDARADQLAGEFSVDYLASSEAPARIREHLPDVRLIVSFRNPIDQIYSNYWHSLRQGFNCLDDSLPDFDTALVQHRTRLLDDACFGRHFERWLRYFPADRFLVLFQEDITADPAAAAARLWNFLGVPAPAVAWVPAERSSSDRLGVSPRSARTGRLYNQLYFATNRFVLRPLSRRFGYATSLQLIKRFGLRRIAERIFFRPGYPPMSPDQRVRLRALLAADIQLLAQLTRRDLSHWC